jgi:hypothetical protein
MPVQSVSGICAGIIAARLGQSHCPFRYAGCPLSGSSPLRITFFPVKYQ